MENKTFGQRLTRERQDRYLSQTDLADLAGITRAAISNYEADKVKKPDPETLRQLAHALQVPEEEIYRWAGLLSEKPDPNPHHTEINYLMDQLPEEDQRELIEIAKLKIKRKNR